MAKIACFTIASRNYLSYVKVLFDSVARTNPYFRRYLCLADVDDPATPSVRGEFDVVRADELGIPHFEDFAFRYDIMEFNTAVKPYMCLWLFAHSDVDAIIYLDPDIRCFSALDPIVELLDNGASVVVTPHVTSPLEDGLRPNDSHLLQAGVFNLGFIALARCSEASEFLAWWSRRMATQCINSIPDSLFVDQKWCDLLPCYVGKLAVLRRPGFNVAYWNLSERSLKVNSDGRTDCNGEPLAFFHFSGINPGNPDLLSKHQDRHSLSTMPVVKRLVEDYTHDLKLAGWEQTRDLPYAYGRFADGTPVRDIVRKTYRRSIRPGDLRFGSPFDAGAEAVCNFPAEGVPQSPGPRITRLMHEVFLIRPDIQAIFNLASVEGRHSFANWFEASAMREYGLDDSLVRQPRPAGPAGARIVRTENRANGCDTNRDHRVKRYQRLLAVESVAIRLQRWLPPAIRARLKRYWTSYKTHVAERL